MTETGNPLDVAVVGQGWMAFAGPTGTVYTRDGRLQIAANGDLQTVTGFPVIDSGGAPITVDPNGGPVSIAPQRRDHPGAQRDRHSRPVQHSHRCQSRPLRQFRRHSRSSRDRIDFRLVSRTASSRAMSRARASIRCSELTKLMSASRAFDSTNSLIEGTESTLQNAIRTLGDPAKASGRYAKLSDP